MDPRSHWERVYGTRKPTEASWYQATAALSLCLIRNVVPDRSVPIIDVGSGVLQPFIYCMCRVKRAPASLSAARRLSGCWAACNSDNAR